MAKFDVNVGFSTVEALLILVVVGILGFTGWYVYHSQQVSSKDYSAVSSASVPTYKVNPYAGWKQYCSNYGGICFKYPQTWTMNSTETDEPNATGLTLVSPSGKIEVLYNPAVDGIGGACPPDTCFFQASSIAEPVAKDTGTLKIVQGIYTNSDSQVIMPDYYLSDDNSKLAVGKNVDVGFFVSAFSNPSNSNGIEFLYVRDVNQNGYVSSDAANAWFTTTDVKTAGKILDSVELK